MSPYGRARKKQRLLFLVLLADFLVVALAVGPLSDRHSSLLLTVSSIGAIGVFALCMLLLGSLRLQCPHCGARHPLSTIGSRPTHCSECGTELSAWYEAR